jgi:protoporphyrinogen/coproporphyrinogen III oxidase
VPGKGPGRGSTRLREPMIGIIGGGLSGLFVLHRLRARGVDALLFEGDARVGGVVRTLPLPEGPADVGPVRLRMTPELRTILKETGLEGEAVSAPADTRFHMFRRGRLHPVPRSLPEALGTSLVSWSGKARALRDLVSAPAGWEESVEEVLVRKLGREVYASIAGPLLGGLYASEPGRMYARHTLTPMLLGAGSKRSILLALARARRLDALPVVSLARGMESLPCELARLHRDRIRVQTPVESIMPGRDRGFLLHAGSDRIPAREVVLTAPAPGASRLLGGIAPSAAERLRGLHYNSLAVVVLEGTLPSGGSGFKVALDEPLALRGVTSRAGLGGADPVLTAFLGGMGRETLLAQPDDRLAELAAREFEAVTGAPARPLLVHRTRMPAWDRSWQALEALSLPPGIHLCAAYTRRPGVLGRLAEAGEVAGQIAPEVRPLR